MNQTVIATKFGQSIRGNRTWRAPCGCKIEILPSATGNVMLVFCGPHSAVEAPRA